MSGERSGIAVCVVTRERPEWLERLLRSLDCLDLAGMDETVRVVVVDNDPVGSAGAVIERVRPEIGLDVQHVVEQRAGIPFARNAAVRATLDGGDRCLAFVDDDEVVEPGWLAALVRQMESSGADAVAGPVVTTYEAGTPGWVRASGVFDYKRRASGTVIPHCFTNNVLVRCEALEEMRESGAGGWFDERMVMTGGSDAHLFRRFTRDGNRIVWADDAVVRETLPASRATMGWILRRGYRIGASGAFIERDLRGVVGIARNLLVGSARIVQGVVVGVLTAPLGKAVMVRRVRMAWYGAGLIAGTFGARYNEYTRVHGR